METILRSAAVGILVLALALAVASDLGTRTIPNGCVAAVALCAAPTVTYADDLACAAARSLAGAAAVLALLLAARGLSRKLHGSVGIGAGDIKLLSALGAGRRARDRRRLVRHRAHRPRRRPKVAGSGVLRGASAGDAHAHGPRHRRRGGAHLRVRAVGYLTRLDRKGACPGPIELLSELISFREWPGNGQKKRGNRLPAGRGAAPDRWHQS